MTLPPGPGHTGPAQPSDATGDFHQRVIDDAAAAVRGLSVSSVNASASTGSSRNRARSPGRTLLTS